MERSMRRVIIAVALIGGVGFLSLFIPDIRGRVRSIVRPEPPPPITPLPVSAGATVPRKTFTEATPTDVAQSLPNTALGTATTEPTALAASPTSAIRLTPTPVALNGRLYDAYIPAAMTKQQAYQYSCEFDAAWVILQTYGYNVTVDALIAAIKKDLSVEPYIGEETAEGWIIYGGDIFTAYSGDYTQSYLARTTGAAMRPVFEQYGLEVTPVHDRAGVEAALRGGSLIWMKTTVDFKPWRPALWKTPDGRTHKTVLGNDHALVVIGFNRDVVVIRDVLGPTSTNRQRPYEYEVDWDTFMRVWAAQSFDGLAVAPPQ
jgi:uncharacterized protein YvpB